MTSNYSKILYLSAVVLGSVVAGACASAQPGEDSDPAGTTEQEITRSWTCSATLSYGTHSYTPPPWSMSSHQLLPDRENHCKDYIKSHWLSDPNLLSLLGVTAEENTQICENVGTAAVRVDYGFDARGKSWQFTSTVVAPCPARNYACGFAMSNVSGNICENGRTTRYVTAPNMSAAISACQAAKPSGYPRFCVVLDQDGTASTDASQCEAAPRLGPSKLAPEWRPTRSCCKFEGETTCPN